MRIAEGDFVRAHPNAQAAVPVGLVLATRRAETWPHQPRCLVGDLDHFAPRPLLHDDPAMILHVLRPAHPAEQPRNVCWAARKVQGSPLAKPLHHGEHVYRFARAVQAQDRLEDHLVGIHEEALRPKDRQGFDAALGELKAHAQHRLLELGSLRRRRGLLG